MKKSDVYNNKIYKLELQSIFYKTDTAYHEQQSNHRRYNMIDNIIQSTIDVYYSRYLLWWCR